MAKQYIWLLLFTLLQCCFLSGAVQYICDEEQFNGNLTSSCDLVGSGCSQICNNGYCDDQRAVCECNEGYEMVANECVSQCQEPCPPLAKCTGRGECSCAKGYELDEGACVATCVPACGTSQYCVAPSTCRCLPGYEDLGSGCSLKCEPACGAHATCVGSNQCRCDDGYVNHSGNFSEGCTSTCAMATRLLASSHCECEADFKRAHCPKYATCITPFNCTCIEGYTMANGKCEPRCTPECPKFSSCTRPDVCTCIVGFVLKNGECVPHCPQGCSRRETCTAPNICACAEGYRDVSEGMNYCQPICEPACAENATCIAPNTCQCKEGFYNVGANNACVLEADCPGVFHVYFITLLAVSVLLVCALGFALMLYFVRQKEEPAPNDMSLDTYSGAPSGNTLLRAGKVFGE